MAWDEFIEGIGGGLLLFKLELWHIVQTSLLIVELLVLIPAGYFIHLEPHQFLRPATELRDGSVLEPLIVDLWTRKGLTGDLLV